MKPKPFLALAAAAASLFALVAPSLPAHAATSLAQIRVDGPAHEGARGQILLDLRISCRPGLTATELSLTFSQGDRTDSAGLANPPTCDGKLHRLRVSSDEGFEPGRAHVDIALTLVDTATGDPRGTVTRSKDIFVRPAARILLPRTAVLNADGTVTAVVRARCDEPWTPGDYLVSGSQGGSRFAQTSLTITCDGRFHTSRVTLQSVGDAFIPGRIQLDAELTVFDEFFDPVAQGSATRSVKLV
jgi:hypothetical protein